MNFAWFTADIPHLTATPLCRPKKDSPITGHSSQNTLELPSYTCILLKTK